MARKVKVLLLKLDVETILEYTKSTFQGIWVKMAASWKVRAKRGNHDSQPKLVKQLVEHSVHIKSDCLMLRARQ